MPRLSPVESRRAPAHLSLSRSRRRALLSPSRSFPAISGADASWEMCDDYRTDRFSENYYRHYWGVHKGGMVLGMFLGLVLAVGGVVGVAFAM